jgi:UDP-N-acetylglucosamine 4-epimerase
MHSQASISKASRMLGYAPHHDARSGLRLSLPWYETLSRKESAQDATH